MVDPITASARAIARGEDADPQEIDHHPSCQQKRDPALACECEALTDAEEAYWADMRFDR